MGKLIRLSLLPSVRPSFLLQTPKEDIVTLLDTGSNSVIWCASEDSLREAFPSIKKTNYVTPIGGFGKGYFLANVWLIPLFEIKSEDVDTGCGDSNVLIIKNLLVAVHPSKQYNFKLLLGATTFSELNYSIHNYPKSDRYIEIELTRDTGIYGCTINPLNRDEVPRDLKEQVKLISADIQLINGTTIFYAE